MKLKYILKISKTAWHVEKLNKLASNWPQAGHIIFDGFYAKYRDDLDYALKDLNFEIQSGEKIGICGEN